MTMNLALAPRAKTLLEGHASLTQLLRQTQLVAAKLNLPALEAWVRLELAGYPKQTQPPAYRKVFTERLEAYNALRQTWHFAGHLAFALNAHQPIAQIETFSREQSVTLPVEKKFSIKNDYGDSFGSDWPQRFVVAGAQYEAILEAVAQRWTDELDQCGLAVTDPDKLLTALSNLA